MAAGGGVDGREYADGQIITEEYVAILDYRFLLDYTGCHFGLWTAGQVSLARLYMYKTWG